MLSRKAKHYTWKLSEAKEIVKLKIAGKIGDDYARAKLDRISRFKKEFGIAHLDPAIYREDYSSLSKLVDMWVAKIQTFDDIENRIERRGITLSEEQKRMLNLLKKEVRMNPFNLDRIIRASEFAHENRETIVEAVPTLLTANPRSSWLRYLRFKLLPKGADEKEFWRLYGDARFRGLSFWAANKFMGLYGRKHGDAAEKYAQILHVIGGPRIGGAKIHPHLEALTEDPKRAAEMAELFAAIGEVTTGHSYLEEVIRDGYLAHRENGDRNELSKLYELVRKELKDRFGGDLEELPLMGRHHERLKKVQTLKGVWKEILDKNLKNIREELNKKDLPEEKRKELEDEYSKAIERAAKEFVDYLEGDEMIRRWLSRIRRKIRSKEGGIPKPKENKPIEESIELKKHEIPKKMSSMPEAETLLAEATKKEKEQKEGAIQAYHEAAEALAPEIEAANNGPLDIHLKDHLTRIIGETYEMLPLSLKDKAAMIRIDDLYRQLFNELKANGVLTNALHVKDPEMLDEINRELKAAIIAHVYSRKLEMPKNETIAKILQDIESKKSAINEWQERLAVAKTHEQEYHDKQIAVAERIAEMLAEHVYANPNMKREIMKRVHEAAERNEVSKYLETFIKNSLERVGKKTTKGTDKIVFEASLKRMMKELRAHESNVRAARVEAKRAELAIRNLMRDMQRSHQNLEIERRKLAEQQEDILRQYHKELAREIAKILLERANKNHIKFTTISRK